ncbi:MAG: Asp-tRNA(Asn)/Glu-tRNA(Gln) amidotransferase subunit GatB [Clostridia bacterium]
MKYDVVIGLEIHAELSTQSNIFCECAQQFGGEPNTRCCPKCVALPGALPVLNQAAIKYAVIAGLCLNCHINEYSAFDRKNYFYPDLPKAYQISQFYFPICENGFVEINGKKIRINRIHLEEDAGKLIHDDIQGISLADYNRSSVPLIEIVTEPDITSGEEARAFTEEVVARLRYAGVCDAKMEEGSLRCDVNISLKPKGAKEFGTRAEIKNLNSFKSIVRAVDYEIKRQSDILDRGAKVKQETRRFNDSNGKTVSMRSKEEADDYRYFPDPDIPAVLIDKTKILEIKESIPAMPAERKKIYVEDYGIPEADADLILTQKEYSDFFNETAKYLDNYRGAASLFVVELFRIINDKGYEGEFKFSPEQFVKLVKMLDEDKITKAAQKKILWLMFDSGKDPEIIAKENNLLTVRDVEGVQEAVRAAIETNSKAVSQYREGVEKVFGFLMGQVMRQVGKSASPDLVREELLKALKG